MIHSQLNDYHRIAEAIDYIKNNFKAQPDLDAIAQKVGLSPFHFQRLFTSWAGVSPKKFLQFTSLAYAKKKLKDDQATLFDTAFETGLSGTGRLHDLFITLEGMTPGEYKNGGETLTINYRFVSGTFGNMLIASTSRGVCHLAFAEDLSTGLLVLKNKFPNAIYQEQADNFQQQALAIFKTDWTELSQIKLHLKGTAFQLKVWETLLKIPPGKLATYGTIASRLKNPAACRAVGTAIGDNPVAYIIPCHRVIRSTGLLGGYHWGTTRKTAIIAWEAGWNHKTTDATDGFI